ncbi:ATP-binding protein, partial [Escherichia coli]|uniref:ATP-binding protein n=1 Tax=Escherichia coli TaxID=562 RepID=UPI001C588F5C
VKKIELIGRNRTLTDIRTHLSGLRAEGKQGWVCLWGPGGIGKTQLAAAYALESRPYYSQVFKICGTSPETIQEEFASLVDTQAKSLQDPDG